MWTEIPEHRRATAWTEEAESARDGAAPMERRMPALAPGTLYRMVAGVDPAPRPMTPAELADLGDPMAGTFFRARKFPMTVQDVLAGLPAPGPTSPQSVYLIGEAGQIPPERFPKLRRDLRFAITRGVAGRDIDLLVSTGANGDPAKTFLQVAAWDPVAKVFNYYMRITPTWVWSGNSWSALAAESRGKACFDSHVNGSVVMKELKLPWINWQSQAATIQIAPTDPLLKNPLYQQVTGAQNLEVSIRPLVRRWTAARIAHVTTGGTVDHPDHLLRQLVTTTTINLASTATQSSGVTKDSPDLVLPVGFWLNNDALFDVLEIPSQAGAPAVRAALYVDSLTTFQFRLEEKASGFTQPGDTFFAFVVPEAAYEDLDVVSQLIDTEVLTARFVACALMVDFTNPVFSPDRAHLMRYVPRVRTPVAGLSERIAGAIVAGAAGKPASSPEAVFAANWAVPERDWRTVFGARTDAYLGKVSARITTPTGFEDYTRLAESRRRDFRRMKLNEFALTLPVTNIAANAPALRMGEDGTVTVR
ncbi:hypothetical protein Lfu02_42820 [Longispora fulva]|uniref:Uncharacterized protein n=1 Tax=Longispora fulva TaxID=619741 RepID=A0A8J7KFY1_9ACTN|nr:hypothetical protein [Longispora fulva]MBG6136740.1 hypothetical protein [Longispora fulva]GIG59910.1 hypothetical protein Lfu02_42820 [Longispora fulva]